MFLLKPAIIHVVNYETSHKQLSIEVEEIINSFTKSIGNALSTSELYEQAIINQYRFMTLLEVRVKKNGQYNMIWDNSFFIFILFP